jgi:hypothetical protein
MMSAVLRADRNERLLLNQLSQACKTLKSCRNCLMHGNLEAASLENLNSSFEAGIELLTIFSARSELAPANSDQAQKFRAKLESLRVQFDQHELFIQARMDRLGWRHGEPGRAILAVPPDAQTALEEGKRSNEVLKRIFKWNSGIQHLIPALFRLEEAKLKCGPQRIRQEMQLAHFDYAQTLQVRSVCCILQLLVVSYLFKFHPCCRTLEQQFRKYLMRKIRIHLIVISTTLHFKLKMQLFPSTLQRQHYLLYHPLHHQALR